MMDDDDPAEDGDRDYTIRGYYPASQGGGLAVETWHRGEYSRDVEVALYRTRMAAGEIGHIEIVCHVNPDGVDTTETIWADGQPEPT